MKYVLCEHFVVLSNTLWIDLFLCSQLDQTKYYQIFYCLSNLLQCLTTHCNFFFFYFFLCHNLCPLSLLLFLCTSEKNLSPASLYHPFRYQNIPTRFPSDLVHVNQTCFPQPPPVYHVQQHHNHLATESQCAVC